MSKVSLIGAGSWGTALALTLAHNKHEVMLWEHNAQAADVLIQDRENKLFLPGFSFPALVHVTNQLSEALIFSDWLILAVPSHVLRAVLTQIKPLYTGQNLVSVIKGIENESLLLPTQIIEDVLGEVPLAVLSGPTHAEEIAQKKPAAVVVAAKGMALAEQVQELFATAFLKVYTNEDVLGVQLGGSLKNVMAIAAGICDGLEYGDNSKSALMTRALAEMTSLGMAMGAQKETFYGLSGLGDLITTCMSRHSRNRYVGEQIGRGKSLDEVLQEMRMVAEGVKTAKSAYALAQQHQVDVPILEQMHEVLFAGKNPQEAVKNLMSRQNKSE